MVQAFPYFNTFVPQFPQPCDRGALSYFPLLSAEAKSRTNYLINMSTQLPRCDRSQRLSCQVFSYTEDDTLIVKQGKVAVEALLFRGRKTVVTEKIPFIRTNLASEIRTLPNTPGHCEAGIYAWLSASRVLLITVS
jgi:hypothetical protein